MIAKNRLTCLEAMAGGASAGMQLALNVGAMLIAFVGLIALITVF